MGIPAWQGNGPRQPRASEPAGRRREPQLKTHGTQILVS